MRNALTHLDLVRARLAALPIRSLVRTALSPNKWQTDLSALTALTAVLAASAYYVGALVGLSVRFQSSPISPVWPPNTILLVALLLVPTQRWGKCLLAVFGAHMLVELPNGVPFVTASGLFVTNVAEAAIGAAGVYALAGKPPWLGSLRKVTIYLVCAVLVAPVLTSFADAAVVILTRWADADDYWLLWTTRCVSNVMAQLTIGPALLLGLTIAPTWMRDATSWRKAEAALLATGLLVVGVTVFDGRIKWEPASPVLLYALLPFLLWAAIRFGVGGTSVSLLGITILATWGAIRGRGPFSVSSPANDVISLQLFLIGISAPMVFLAALIRDREETKAALRKSEERYRVVASNFPHGAVLLFGKDLRHLFADGQGLPELGLSKASVEGKTIWEAVPHNLAVALAPRYKAALSGEHAAFDLVHAGHAYQMQTLPIQYAGALAGMAVVQDVTEQRRARDELERERTQAVYFSALSQEFGTLLDHSPDAITRFDRALRLRYVNPRAQMALGIPASEGIGKTYSDLGFPESVYRPWEQALREVIATGEPCAFDSEVSAPDGQVQTLHIRYVPEFGPDENVESVLGIASDITELRHAQARANEHAAQLEAIFEAMADGVLVSDTDGHVVRMNRAWQDIFRGFSDLTGMSAKPGFAALPLAGQVDRWMQLQRMSQYLPADANGQAISHEATPTYRALHGETVTGANAVDERVEASDGRVYEGSIAAAPIRDAAGNIVGAVTVARDVTVHRQLERQVREHVAQAAAEAERGRLARELHDTVTQELYSACLLAETLPKVWKQCPDEAASALGMLHALTRSGLATLRMLLLELLPAGLEQMTLPTMLRQLLDAMRTRAGVPLSLEIEGDENSWLVVPREVKQAFYRVAQEAVTNAVKYATASQITVRLGRGRSGSLRMEIADDGVGFDPRTSTPGHFGLKMMRERAQEIGARVHVVSQAGQGTRVVIQWMGSARAPEEPSAVGIQQRIDTTGT